MPNIIFYINLLYNFNIKLLYEVKVQLIFTNLICQLNN